MGTQALKELEDFTEVLLEHYFDSLKEIGNRHFNISAAIITPHSKFKELKKKKELKESIKQAKDLIDSFSDVHTSHTNAFWEYVEDLEIQEIEAKKILDRQFVDFQNRAWQTIKMLKRRAEDRLDEFEGYSITQEVFVKEKLLGLKDMTFEKIRDSWIEHKNPLDT